jgi:transcriptional regulator with XRE-family HTH domain
MSKSNNAAIKKGELVLLPSARKKLGRRRTSSVHEHGKLVFLSMTLATIVKYFRKSAGLTQNELARQLDCSQGRISQIESASVEEGLAGIDMIAELADTAGYDARLIFIRRRDKELTQFNLSLDPMRVKVKLEAQATLQK